MCLPTEHQIHKAKYARQGEIHKSTILARDFSTPLSVIDQAGRTPVRILLTWTAFYQSMT